MQRQWRELHRTTALLQAMLDDAQSAWSGYQHRCVGYQQLQERQASLSTLTVPSHQVEARTWWQALRALEQMEAGEGMEEDAPSSLPHILSYGSVAAALQRHQQRWGAKVEQLQRTHDSIQQQHAAMSAHTPPSPTCATLTPCTR